MQFTVKSLIYEKLAKHYFTNKRVDDLFIKGYEIHNTFQTVGVFADEFNQFTEQFGISYTSDEGELKIIEHGVIPRSKHEIELLIETFKS